MDVLTKAQRSYCMSRIRGKDTKPEITVRKIIYSLGYRYRLHKRSLPGYPDIVLTKQKKIIFVNGCWWHRHDCKLGRRSPKSRLKYWLPKLRANKDRYSRNVKELRNQGWRVLTLWECQIYKQEKVTSRIIEFLEGNNNRTNLC